MKRNASLVALVLIAVAWTIEAASPVIVDANGNVLAFYSTGYGAGGLVKGVTTEGYQVVLDARTGRVSGVGLDPSSASVDGLRTYYSEGGCTGNAYMVVNGVSGFTGGTVFLVDGAQPVLRYIPKATIPTATAVMSYRETGTGNCAGFMNANFVVVPVFVNDPAITGLPNTLVYPAPLRIEIATISEPSGRVFRDGFETVG